MGLAGELTLSVRKMEWLRIYHLIDSNDLNFMIDVRAYTQLAARRPLQRPCGSAA
jgi:hypothetical protein